MTTVQTSSERVERFKHHMANDMKRTRTLQQSGGGLTLDQKNPDLFSQMPVPIANEVMTYLSGADLARAEGVNKFWKKMAKKNHLWHDIFLKELEQDPPIARVKSEFKHRYIADQEAKAEADRVARALADRGRFGAFKSFLSYCGSGAVGGCYFFLILIFSILLPIKLDGDDDMSWGGVFVPLYILDVFMLIPLLTDIMNATVWPYMYDDIDEGGIIRALNSIYEDSPCWMFTNSCGIISFVVWTIWVPIKATNPVDNADWIVVNIPLFLALFVCIFAGIGICITLKDDMVCIVCLFVCHLMIQLTIYLLTYLLA
jgi:F-box-like